MEHESARSFVFTAAPVNAGGKRTQSAARHRCAAQLCQAGMVQLPSLRHLDTHAVGQSVLQIWLDESQPLTAVALLHNQCKIAHLGYNLPGKLSLPPTQRCGGSHSSRSSYVSHDTARVHKLPRRSGQPAPTCAARTPQPWGAPHTIRPRPPLQASRLPLLSVAPGCRARRPCHAAIAPGASPQCAGVALCLDRCRPRLARRPRRRARRYTRGTQPAIFFFAVALDHGRARQAWSWRTACSAASACL